MVVTKNRPEASFRVTGCQRGAHVVLSYAVLIKTINKPQLGGWVVPSDASFKNSNFYQYGEYLFTSKTVSLYMRRLELGLGLKDAY